MIKKFAPPSVTIQRYWDSPICDVVVVVRDQEMVIRCPSYSQAMKWARLECKSYKITEPDVDFPDDNQETNDVPLFQTKIDLCSGGERCGRHGQSSPNAGARHDAEIDIGEGLEPPLRDQHH
jgi:hypothetical protein